MIETIITIIIAIYLGSLMGSIFGIIINFTGRTNSKFIRPKGLWILVPFRVSGWKDRNNKVYKINWVWSKINSSSKLSK